MCRNHHCSHTTLLKKRKQESEQPEFLEEYFKIKPSTDHVKTRESVSKKPILFNVPQNLTFTLQSPNTYLEKTGELFVCVDDDEVCEKCNGTLESSDFSDVTLYCKGNSYMCKGIYFRVVFYLYLLGISSYRVINNFKTTFLVMTKKCVSCNTVLYYDGGCQSILNMGKLLVHHSLLRDYMYHFLHSNR